MRLVFVSAAVLTLIAFSQVRAQESVRPVLTIEVVGETIYDLAAEVSLNPSADQSTARGVVMAWCALSDESSRADANKQAQAVVANVSAAAINELEAALLSTALAKSQADKRAELAKREAEYVYTSSPSKIIEETAEDDGTKLIVTSQMLGLKFKDFNGEWVSRESEGRMRFTVVKCDDGKWRIQEIELGQPEKNPTSETPAFVYTALSDYQREVAIKFDKDAKLAKPELKTATAAEAALSFANELRRFNDAVSIHTLILTCRATTELSDNWLTPAYKDGVSAKVADWAKNKKPGTAPSEVEEVRDAADDSATVVFKFTDTKASDKLVVKVIKEGDAWRVSEVGDLRSAGTAEEKYKAKPDVYRRW